MPYLAGEGLNVCGGNGLNGRCEGGEVEVVGRFGVEGVDVDCSPVELCHFEVLDGLQIGVEESRVVSIVVALMMHLEGVDLSRNDGCHVRLAAEASIIALILANGKRSSQMLSASRIL